MRALDQLNFETYKVLKLTLLQKNIAFVTTHAVSRQADWSTCLLALGAVSKRVLLLFSFVKVRFLLRLCIKREHSLCKKLVLLAGKAKLPNLEAAPRAFSKLKSSRVLFNFMFAR